MVLHPTFILYKDVRSEFPPHPQELTDGVDIYAIESPPNEVKILMVLS